MEKTFVMIKPDGVSKRLTGEVISRLEAKGLELVQIVKLHPDRYLAEALYQEHAGKPFFERLITHISSGPVVAMIFQGADAVTIARLLIGDTDPLQAAPGTIRGTYALHRSENIVHGADSAQSANREAALFFVRE